MHLPAIKVPLPSDLARPLGPRNSHLSRVPSSPAVHVPTNLPPLPSLSLPALPQSCPYPHVNNPLLQEVKFDQKQQGELKERELGMQEPDSSSATAPDLLYD